MGCREMLVVFESGESWERGVWLEAGERVVARVVELRWARVVGLMSMYGRQESVDFQPGSMRPSLAIDGDGVRTPSLRMLERA